MFSSGTAVTSVIWKRWRRSETVTSVSRLQTPTTTRRSRSPTHVRTHGVLVVFLPRDAIQSIERQRVFLSSRKATPMYKIRKKSHMKRPAIGKQPSRILKVIAIGLVVYDLLSVACSKNTFILHRFRDIIDYLPKIKKVPWLQPGPLEGLLSIRRLIFHVANHCTKFEVYSLSHSRDILGGLKI